MMNAALKSFNSDKVIVESDDIDTMNSKLEMFTGKEGKVKAKRQGGRAKRAPSGFPGKLRDRSRDLSALLRLADICLLCHVLFDRGNKQGGKFLLVFCLPFFIPPCQASVLF